MPPASNVKRKLDWKNGLASILLTATPEDVEIKLNQQTQKLLLNSSDWRDYVQKIYRYNEYADPSYRKRLLEIFARYDNDDGAQLNNLNSIMIGINDWSAGLENDDPDEDKDLPNTSPFEIQWLQWMGEKILEISPMLLFRNSPNAPSQTMFQQGVVAGWIWALESLYSYSQRNDFKNGIESKTFLSNLSRVLQDGTINSRTVLDIAVEGGRIGMVNILIKLSDLCEIDQSLRASPIHTAVSFGSIEIVKSLIDSYPGMVTTLLKDKSVLQTLSSSRIKADVRTELQEFLVKKIYRLKRTVVIKKLLHGPLGDEGVIPLKLSETKSRPSSNYFTAREYHLDLSYFDTPPYDLGKFLQRISKSSSGVSSSSANEDLFDRVVFAATMISVTLPLIVDGDEDRRTKKLCGLFDWLRGRNVDTIIELKIPDSRESPYQEEHVGEYLSAFKEIEELDWVKLDMSLEILGVDQAEKGKVAGVQKLKLYSANWGMISYWTGPEGVVCYPKVSSVTIIIVKNLIGDKRAFDYKKRAKVRLSQAKKQRYFDFKVLTDEWEIKPVDDSLSTHPVVGLSKATAILGLEPFLGAYKSLSFNRTLPGNKPDPGYATRVAILDTGVDISNKYLKPQIEKGFSFVEIGDPPRESPWWLASDPHGTQMAHLIRSIDPNCKLFIAKVGVDRSYVIDPLNIIDAVEWAIAHRVDVISISMTFYESPTALKDKLVEAHELGIIVLCSTAEGGQLGPPVYPAEWKDCTTAISACNRHFAPNKYTEQSAKYFLPGERVSADSLSYVEAEETETVSGSSVATAMAAGLASLILSCRNWARESYNQARDDAETKYPRSEGVQRREVVALVFKAMLQEKTGNSVNPSVVFNEKAALDHYENLPSRKGEMPEKADPMIWQKWIGARFGPSMRYDVEEGKSPS